MPPPHTIQMSIPNRARLGHAAHDAGFRAGVIGPICKARLKRIVAARLGHSNNGEPHRTRTRPLLAHHRAKTAEERRIRRDLDSPTLRVDLLSPEANDPSTDVWAGLLAVWAVSGFLRDQDVISTPSPACEIHYRWVEFCARVAPRRAIPGGLAGQRSWPGERRASPARRARVRSLTASYV
jgi:hypothetical protein